MLTPIVSSALIDSLGTPELILILVVTLLLFGANRVPELAKGMGKAIREFKNAANEPDEVAASEETTHSASPEPAAAKTAKAESGTETPVAHS